MSGVREFDVEGFLKHEVRGRSEFVGGDWKKDPGYIDIWLHRDRPFGMVIQHGVPRIDTRDDRETGRSVRTIFTGNYKCLEEEDVFADQYFRDKKTGERKNPPRICPICKMVEHIHMMVIRGELPWLTPIFDFDIGNREKNILIRAAGMWNGYKPAKLSDDQKAEMEEAGISPAFGWKESMLPGPKYILCLVDDAQVGRGVQIMKEGQSVGDKIKTCIGKEMKRNPRNPALGDPVQNPYPFRIEYDESKSYSEKYEVFRLDLEITPEIEKLITEEAAPDIARLDGSYQPEVMRSMLEQVCQLDGLPWDEFFSEEACALLAPADDAEEAPEKAKPAPRRPAAPPQRAQGRGTPPPAPQPRGRAAAPPQGRGAPPASRAAAPAPRGAPPARPASREAPRPRQHAPEPEPEFACNGCDAVMKASDTRCGNCGMEYEVEQPDPPPRLQKRSEVSRASAPAPRNGAPATRAPAPSAPRRQAGQRLPPPTKAHQEVSGGGIADAADEIPPGLAQEFGEDDVGFGEFGEDKLPF
jgi:hypothetical protein